MNRAAGWRFLAELVLAAGVLTALAWAEDIIEMATYIPAPGASGNPFNRLHADRATVGTPYGTENPADLPNGTLLVLEKIGIGMEIPSVRLDVAQGGAIRVGNAYLSSGKPQYAMLASNGWFNGSIWMIPDPSRRSGAFVFDNETLRFYQTQTPGGTDWAGPRFSISSGGDVGIGIANPQSPAPGGQPGNLDVNDIYLRSKSRWLSQGGSGNSVSGSYAGTGRPRSFNVGFSPEAVYILLTHPSGSSHGYFTKFSSMPGWTAFSMVFSSSGAFAGSPDCVLITGSGFQVSAVLNQPGYSYSYLAIP